MNLMRRGKLVQTRGNLFVRYFTSFIGIILIPIIIFSALLYIFITGRMDMEQEARLNSSVQALATQCDTLLVQLEGEVTSFALDLENNDLVAMQLSIEQKMQKLAELRRRLESSANTNPAIDTIGVYFGLDQRAMTQKGYYQEGAELDWEPIRLLLEEQQINGIHVLRREDGPVQLLIAKSIPIHQKKGRNFVLCTLQGDQLNWYAQYGWEDAQSFVLDESGHVLSSSLPAVLSAGVWPDAEGNMPDGAIKYKSVTSKVMPWRYVVSISQETASQDNERFLKAILLIVAVLSGLGIAFSYALAHAFYRPISQLAHSARMELNKIRGRQVVSASNDIAFINQAVSAISAYGTELEQCLESGRGRVLSSVLAHLLQGNAMAREEVYEILENYLFDTENRQFTVFAVELRSYDISQKWDGWIARYQLESCMHAVLGGQEGQELLAVETGKYKLCGIISRPYKEAADDQGIFLQILNSLCKSWPCARLAVGGMVLDIMEISDPYTKATAILSGAPARQEAGIVDAACDTDSRKMEPGLAYRWLEYVANKILIEDGQTVEQMVKEWFDKMVLADNASFPALQEWAIQMTAYLAVVLKERMPEVIGWPAPIALEKACGILNADELCHLTKQYCREAIACIQLETQHHTLSKIQQAAQYVDANYMLDISLTQVADLLDITPQYLSSTFKIQVGRNFTEYMNYKRLEEAVRLLKETKRNVQQIAEQVGYNSVQYFARKFKEAYGITPSQYRENIS